MTWAPTDSQQMLCLLKPLRAKYRVNITMRVAWASEGQPKVYGIDIGPYEQDREWWYFSGESTNAWAILRRAFRVMICQPDYTTAAQTLAGRPAPVPVPKT